MGGFLQEENIQNRIRITDIPKEERPRERLIKNGAQKVSNAELIAILLGQGSKQYNALDMAKLLLKKFGSLSGLADASLNELQTIPGIGPAKAITLLAAFQLYRNMEHQRAEKGLTSYNNPRRIADIYIPLLGHKKSECVYVVLLDSTLKKIADVELTIGLLSSVMAHPREVFNPAIKQNAHSIILIHNHPSGNPEPSQADIRVTKQIYKAGDILGIPLKDHIIVTEEDYFSFHQKGLLTD